MKNSNQLVIEVNNLSKSYGQVKAVNGISFQVQAGEVFGMLGPNGAGKTTTMEILIGLRSRDGGEVKVLGIDPETEPNRLKNQIGVQLQNVFLFERLKVYEIIELFASFYPRPLPVEEAITLVGLYEKRNALLKELSGGQLQRVSVAMALVSNGKIIFLDEPTTGLDPQSRRQLWDVILSLKNAGKTVFLTTHFMDEAQKLCDRVAIVDHGQIIALGSPQELIEGNFQETALELARTAFTERKSLADVPGVKRVQVSEDSVTLYSTDIALTISELMVLASKAGVSLDNIRIRQATLEDVFLKLTGRSIRE
ncbi:ABC transporter ATP-binding protein [Carboxydothermus pertinax]|uniref:ABC transporter n=1 Tax=Carboxydothermus pertinax TaxID=870242 RepID=A0A1L8CXE8_9THEO|nr:ABC transporter ATP-binding protein [Carboxydothermus pertinax]GAV23551.1 ABC transporter [Carboxydothermus pertinax]